jgi:hypothetical protein
LTLFGAREISRGNLSRLPNSKRMQENWERITYTYFMLL